MDGVWLKRVWVDGFRGCGYVGEVEMVVGLSWVGMDLERNR